MNSTSDALRVGFIGLGSQGAPMARRIIGAGYPTTLWARRPGTLEPFAGTGARPAGSPAELAAASDLVCVCVRDDADVEAVVDAVLGGLAAGGVIAVHSTVHPDTCRRLAERAQASGVGLIDAPVSGGGPAAEAGRLLVMVGGDDETVQRCRPVFASYGDPVVHLGPVGAGQVTKLLNNAAFTAHLGVAASLLALGQSLGVDQLRLADVISHGSGDSFALQRVASAGGTVARIGEHAGHLLRKDVRLIAEVAAAPAAADGAGQRPADRGDTLLAAADAALALMNVGR
ncbi:MAG TPA: NAD(P)-dependent oxidoreductase [Trebonia sp.]|jgi:3-hydroxyisobutyrate dehydrogenase-like beta-hydroxyacid dehydrogenase|nr:NAD(P)-dependent oxidoreductase [Trebonia sp.]